MRPRWKVCGITRAQDALAAVEAGADAVGFVFYPPSPRCVSVDRAAEISAVLPRETWRFGVFVDAPAGTMAEAVDDAGLDFLQLSGDEPPERCAGLPRHAFKALRLAPGTGPREAEGMAGRYPECTLLVDAHDEEEYGGTGRRAEWRAAAHLARRHRLMLAGGLTPANVGAAVDAVGPWAVDVSSGVEISPGRKDPEKLRAFARALESLT